MKEVKIKCPAKINLTLEVVSRRDDGYHNIKSVMQLIDLYDYLTIKACPSDKNKIVLSGTSTEIPYNEHNLVYKAAELYLKSAKITNIEIFIHIEKNIPVAAGLAGGSTDAAGTVFGLNQLFKALNNDQLEGICATLGSDLNVCLNGGCLLATSRGENTEKLPVSNYSLSLIKPIGLGISAKEAYTRYAQKKFKPENNMTEKLVNALQAGNEIKDFLYNDLEYAVFDKYKELQTIKNAYPNAIMSGSGPTYFILEQINKSKLPNNYLVISGLNFITDGVQLA